MSKMQLFKDGVRCCLPTILGYWAVSFACGAVGAASGFSVAQVAGLSIFLYAGSAQFLFYSLALAGAGVFQIVLAVAFINIRYLLINTYMAQFFDKSSKWEKIIGGALITDETFGVAANYAKQHNDNLPFYWLLGLNLTAWINWWAASITGALLASILPSWIKESLGFSLVGMFIGLLILGFQTSKTRLIDCLVVLVAILITILLHNGVDSNLTVIFSTLIAATVGMLVYLVTKKDKT